MSVNNISNSEIYKLIDAYSDMPKVAARSSLRDELVYFASDEQRDLLKYSTDETLEKIESYRNSDALSEVASVLEKGTVPELRQFFLKYREIKDAHFILLAAYCYGVISLEDLITTFTFLNVAIKDPQFSLVLNVCKSEIAVSSVSKKIAITVSKENMTKIGQFHIDHILGVGDIGPGYFKLKVNGCDKYGFSSFPLIKRLFEKNALWHRLVPTLGMPDRDQFKKSIIKGQSPYSIFLPSHATISYLHGENDDPVWSAVHDLFHTSIRIKNWEDLDREDVVFPTIDALETATKSRPKVSVPLVEQGYVYPKLAQGATVEDLATVILDQLSGDYLDGAGKRLYQFKSFSTKAKFMLFLAEDMSQRRFILKAEGFEVKKEPFHRFSDVDKEKALNIATACIVKEMEKLPFAKSWQK